MLAKKIQEALSKQLNAELYSSYLYLSMSAYFEARNLPGFANWMRVQTQEELTHAMKFYDFINERGGRVILEKIDGPPTDWDSPVAVFDHVYKHEQKVTGLINDLVNLAIAEKDHATNSFLQWFVSEQVEEESSANDVLEKVKLVGKSGDGLLMTDRELAQRVFTPPATGKGGEK
ncbi:ferritin [candidate division TA06 bacterium]|uniref:Ferritin n=1 Tax=candidate division TA06 bacterium TaxID=2250710 RepID=A0A523UVG4_UNCT6|nr:MAG: ferritin [candidate division TA06 bacterium]